MANQTYHELAAEILKLIGGKENISFLTHCVTRLRFNLKDQSLADEEAIGKLNGVLGTKIQNRQFQVIIGNKVNEVYACLLYTSITRAPSWQKMASAPPLTPATASPETFSIISLSPSWVNSIGIPYFSVNRAPAFSTTDVQE